jgi:hypothetical protein
MKTRALMSEIRQAPAGESRDLDFLRGEILASRRLKPAGVR